MNITASKSDIPLPAIRTTYSSGMVLSIPVKALHYGLRREREEVKDELREYAESRGVTLVLYLGDILLMIL